MRGRETSQELKLGHAGRLREGAGQHFHIEPYPCHQKGETNHIPSVTINTNKERQHERRARRPQYPLLSVTISYNQLLDKSAEASISVVIRYHPLSSLLERALGPTAKRGGQTTNTEPRTQPPIKHKTTSQPHINTKPQTQPRIHEHEQGERTRYVYHRGWGGRGGGGGRRGEDEGRGGGKRGRGRERERGGW